MGKSCREYAPKVSPRPLFNFGKQPKTAIVCKKFFKKQDILNKGYQKAYQKVNFVFSFPFNGQSH